jgi:hypothetical protein
MIKNRQERRMKDNPSSQRTGLPSKAALEELRFILHTISVVVGSTSLGLSKGFNRRSRADRQSSEYIMAPSKLIDGHTPEHLLKCAEDIIRKKTKDSVVMDREAEARVPKFKESGKNRTVAQQ